jgi:hypothetical protein
MVQSIMLIVLLCVNEIFDICTNYEMKVLCKKSLLGNFLQFEPSSYTIFILAHALNMKYLELDGMRRNMFNYVHSSDSIQSQFVLSHCGTLQ